MSPQEPKHFSSLVPIEFLIPQQLETFIRKMKTDQPIQRFSYRRGKKQLTGRYIASMLKHKQHRQRCGSPRLVQAVPRQPAVQVQVHRFQVEVRQVVPEVRPLGLVGNDCQLNPSGEFPAPEVPRLPRPARPQPPVVRAEEHSLQPHVEEEQVDPFCLPLEFAGNETQPDPYGVGLESGAPPQLPEEAAFLPPRAAVAAPDQHKVFQQSLEAAASQEASDWSVVLEDLEKYNML